MKPTTPTPERYEHALVRFLSTEDGEEPQGTDKKWHWIISVDASRALCSGQVFGYGESAIDYEIKLVKKGGITCPNCLQMIKEFKAIKL